ncbi:DNA polymerase/3'-5' exonuclease PolX [Rhodovibrio salinarum]|uniref:DNA polymerase beta n=1 Tax=Rhodovibrio salinarum TaxID=1087 RepID=A0A934QJS1_9PROT|nr:DNA polymerase/3'-5' exonuclease PolX [Rhodovibrio salinarum]MBK1698166.1 DNA polymerase/3'-5' exonuclease PolX [Rhodovibrio salinarum]
MPTHNRDIAAKFDELADLLEIQGANVFRVRAYRNGARTLRDLPHSVVQLLRDGTDLTELPGIGADLAQKTREIVETGELSDLQEIVQDVPESLIDVMGIAGLGPKRVKTLYEALGVRDLAGLKKATESGEIQDLSGFGKKTEQNILEELATRGSGEKRFRRRDAEELAEPLIEMLRQIDGVDQAIIAGSYRRRKETVGDLDILLSCSDAGPVMDRFVAYDDVQRVLSHGQTRASVVLKGGLQVDLRAVARESYGAALHYFTGSQAHNIRVRQLGQQRGLKVNEYGVFEGETRVAGRREVEVFEAVGLPEIVPELREDRGEIEAAQTDKLPDLVTLDDICGNLHSHTDWSDGAGTLEEMAQAAKARGLSYLAITDHSKAVRVAGGLDADRLARQIDAIDDLNESLDGITLLKGIEVDILEDGTLDLPDAVLARLDLTVCSIHSRMNLSGDKQTTRVLKAMENPNFTILGHPTGRLLGERAGYQLDMEQVIAQASQGGHVLEINAQPARLDLDDTHAKMAREAGVKLSIATDAHAGTHLDLMRFGVDQARRGWVTADDVINTRDLQGLRKLLRG